MIQYVSFLAEWRISTFCFYVAIIFGTYFIMRLLKNKSIRLCKKKHSISMGLLAVAIVLILIKAFCVSGRDVRTGYYYDYLSAVSLSNFRDNTVEIGYRILMVFIRILFGSNGYPIFLFVISVATLFPVIYVTNKYQSQISQQVALIMYTSIYYFQGFSLNRIYLSASIGLLAYDAILEKKKWKSMAMILLATCFHISSLIMFVPYVLLMFRRIGKKTILLLETIIGCAVFLGRGSIYSMMASSTRYYVYSASNGVNIGFEQFAYYLPIIFLWYYSKKKYGIKNRYFEFVSLAYIGSGFLFGLIGYIVPIFGRMQVLFLPLCINVSYYAKPLLNRRRDRYILNILLIIYCISRFYIYISQYYLLDDIMPYITFWGLNI